MKKCMLMIALIVIYASASCAAQDYLAHGLIREVYYNNNQKKPITNCDPLKNNLRFPGNPNEYTLTNVFVAPETQIEYYGQRMRGWFFAPQTGNYTFHTSCNEVCDLYLSNDTDHQNKVLIITQAVMSNLNQFTNPNQNIIHKGIYLRANNKYYIEALTANDDKFAHLSIAVDTPNQSQTPLQPISMDMLSRIRIEKCNISCKTSKYEACIFENNVYGICTCKNEQIVVNNQVICQVDWNEWSNWSLCNISHGIGFMKRSRLCNITNSYEGCFGNSTEIASCNESCSGIFNEWSAWSYCNVSCGHGWQNRTRVCMTDNLADSTKIDFKYCFSNDSCKVNWSHWSSWSQCDVSPDKCFMNRTRECNRTNPYEWCSGNSTEFSDCHNISSCALWAQWSDWSPCNVSWGYMKRSRICNSKYNFSYCNGENSELVNCFDNTNEDHWSSWSHCSVPCGSGFKSRSWVCNLQNQTCLNYANKTSYCYNNESCTGEWCSWGECSKTCGVGYKFSYLNTRLETAKKYRRIKSCMMQKCPVDGMWSPWSSNEKCLATCGDYLTKQTRYCNNPPAENGSDCWGLNDTSNHCEETVLCPVHGEMTFWSSWSLCNQPCQGGVQVKFRNCIKPKYGGSPCNGSTKETSYCNFHQCRKISMNIELFIMNDNYNVRYNDLNSGPSLNLKERIRVAVNNLYRKYNKTVNYDLEVHSMIDGTDRVNL